MTAETEREKAKQAELEAAAREAYALAAAEQAKREAAEQALRDANAKAAAEKAKRELAEQAARDAALQSAADQSARDAALRAAQDAGAIAAAERATREAAESALHEASVRSAADRSERDAALRVARDEASSAAAERVAKEAAEKSAQESNEKAAAEHAAREAAESKLREMAKQAASVDSTAKTPSAPESAKSLSSTPVQSPAAPTPQGAQIRNWLIPIAIFAGAGLLFFIISSFWTTWQNSVSIKTDDAYVRADIAPLSTKSAGIVKTTEVADFQSVKKGEILVELKNDEYRARVDQAQESVRQAEVKLSDMKQRKEQQDARVSQARTVLESSKTSVSQADDAISTAEAAIQEAKAGIEVAKASIAQSQAACSAATADVTRSSLERARQEGLLADESTTKARVEQAVDEHERAVANLEAQKAAYAKAKAELLARQAQLSKASQQLASSRSEKSKSLLMVTNHQAELTAQIKQRELLDGEEKQLMADLAARKAAVTAAKVDLDYTVVRAPADGIVGELKVKPGQMVSAGTQVITLISAKPWVIANYRETQLTNVKEGDSAEVDVDALPGTHLKGHVEKIAPASGAQFSLLPPDNASGNFTKITQRIPVKISFDQDEQRLSNLRPGMSVVATILPGSRK